MGPAAAHPVLPGSASRASALPELAARTVACDMGRGVDLFAKAVTSRLTGEHRHVQRQQKLGPVRDYRVLAVDASN